MNIIPQDIKKITFFLISFFLLGAFFCYAENATPETSSRTASAQTNFEYTPFDQTSDTDAERLLVERTRYLKGLISRAEREYREGMYSQALSRLNAVFIHEPYNPEAQELKGKIERAIIRRRGHANSKVFKTNTATDQEVRRDIAYIKELYHGQHYEEALSYATHTLEKVPDNKTVLRYIEKSEKKVRKQRIKQAQQEKQQRTQGVQKTIPDRTRKDAISLEREQAPAMLVPVGATNEQKNIVPLSSSQPQQSNTLTKDEAQEQALQALLKRQEEQGNAPALSASVQRPAVSNEKQQVRIYDMDETSSPTNRAITPGAVATKTSLVREQGPGVRKLPGQKTTRKKHPSLVKNFFKRILPERKHSPQEKEVNALLRKAKKLFRNDSYEKAIKMYEEVLSLDPKNSTASAGIDRCRERIILQSKENYKEKRAAEQKDVAEKVDFYKTLAEKEQKKGEFALAKALIQKGLLLEPDNKDLLAMKTQNDQYFSEEIASQKEVSGAQPSEAVREATQSSVEINRGIKSYLLGNYQEAIKHFERVLAVNPNDEKAKASILKIQRIMRSAQK